MAAFYLTRTGAPGDAAPLPRKQSQAALAEHRLILGR